MLTTLKGKMCPTKPNLLAKIAIADAYGDFKPSNLNWQFCVYMSYPVDAKF